MLGCVFCNVIGVFVISVISIIAFVMSLLSSNWYKSARSKYAYREKGGDFYLYSLIYPLILVFFLFQDLTKDLFDKYIVGKILSGFNDNGLGVIETLTFILLIGISVYWLITKMRKNRYHLGVNILLIFSVLIICYWNSRIFIHDYEFYPLLRSQKVDWIKISDIPFLLLTICVIILFFQLLFERKNETSWASFIQADFPLSDLGLDLFERKKVYESLIRSIVKNHVDENRSICIGIINRWGEGKTSFLNFLEQDFLQESNTLVVKFNPWLSSNSDNLTLDFFQTLDREFSKYIYTGSLIRRYASNLTNINSPYNPLKYLPNQWIGDKSNQSYFDEIKELIIKLDKRVFILVDDLDRLDTKEVFNLFRVIRNSANFPKLVFIVPFDREYVIRALKENKIHREDEYIKKIFDVELSLPPIAKHHLQSILFNALKDMIENHLHNISKIDSNNLLEQVRKVIYDGGLNFVQNLKYTILHCALFEGVRNKRDIIRFVNSVTISLKDNHKNIYFPDLLLLELLKINNLDVYRKLFENQNYLISDSDENRQVFKLYNKDAQESDNMHLFNERINHYSILENGAGQYCDLVLELFKIPLKDDYNSKFAICYTTNFYNYIEFRENGIPFEDIDSLLYG